MLLNDQVIETFVYELEQNLDAKDDAKFCIMKRVNLLTFINRKINYTLPQRHSRFSTNECRLISSIRLRVIIFLERRRDLKLANLPLYLNYPKKWQSLPYEKVFSTWTLDWARFPCFSINQHCYRIYTMNFGKIKKPNCLIRIYGTPYHCIQKRDGHFLIKKPSAPGVSAGHDFIAFLTNIAMEFILWVLAKSKKIIAQSGFTELHNLSESSKKVTFTWSLDWIWFVR